MFPLAVMLGIAVLTRDGNAWRHGLALAAIGGAIAAYHTLLYAGVIPEPIRPCTADGPSCTDAAMAVAGIPIPYLSLIAFVAIGALLILSRTGETR
jgi:disulfide bond formation protein DsbB